jgi:hypothetical protein
MRHVYTCVANAVVDGAPSYATRPEPLASIVPVKPAVTLWQGGAQKIRRFTRPERASELDWEQQYRKKS